MLNICNDVYDFYFTKIDNFTDYPFNSGFSTEIDDFQFDIINYPIILKLPMMI